MKIETLPVYTPPKSISAHMLRAYGLSIMAEQLLSAWADKDDTPVPIDTEAVLWMIHPERVGDHWRHHKQIEQLLGVYPFDLRLSRYIRHLERIAAVLLNYHDYQSWVSWRSKKMINLASETSDNKNWASREDDKLRNKFLIIQMTVGIIGAFGWGTWAGINYMPRGEINWFQAISGFGWIMALSYLVALAATWREGRALQKAKRVTRENLINRQIMLLHDGFVHFWGERNS